MAGKSNRRGIAEPVTDLVQLQGQEPAAHNLGALEQATAKDDAPKRARHYEDEKRASGGVLTLRLKPETAERFRQMADAGDWLQGSLADKLLEYAMNAVERGDLHLREDSHAARRKTVL
jgi:hypothetical protein